MPHLLGAMYLRYVHSLVDARPPGPCFSLAEFPFANESAFVPVPVSVGIGVCVCVCVSRAAAVSAP